MLKCNDNLAKTTIKLAYHVYENEFCHKKTHSKVGNAGHHF